VNAEPLAPGDASAKKRATFFRRLTSTLILWVLMTGAIMWNQSWIFCLLFALFVLAGLYEYFHLFGDTIGPLTRILTFTVGSIYIVAVCMHVIVQLDEPPFLYDIAALVAVSQGSFWLAYRFKPAGKETLLKVFGAVFGMLYIVINFTFLLRIASFGEGTTDNALPGAWHLLFVVAVTKFSDMGAYVVGSLVGRHKLIPQISPGKTWEGMGGAFLGALIAAIALILLAPGQLQPLTLTHAIILALLLTCAGIGGDLAESVIKRCLSAKDSGHVLPGIGGVMDLIDSLLFTAPVYYVYLKFLGQAS
jgi:phosphatidate cytidylyltransferase